MPVIEIGGKPSAFLWHDDVRPAPAGWLWAKDNNEAMVALEDFNVVECSLDHDLGAMPTGETDPREVLYLQGDSPDGDGYDLVKMMVEHDLVPPIVRIHPWNAPGAKRMRAYLFEHGYESTLETFSVDQERERTHG